MRVCMFVRTHAKLSAPGLTFSFGNTYANPQSIPNARITRLSVKVHACHEHVRVSAHLGAITSTPGVLSLLLTVHTQTLVAYNIQLESLARTDIQSGRYNSKLHAKNIN